MLFRRIEANRDSEALMRAIRTRIQAVHRSLVAIQGALARVPYPFEHRLGDASLGQYVLENLPRPDDPEAVFLAVTGTRDRLYAPLDRIAGRLVEHAEAADTALGLAPFAPRG